MNDWIIEATAPNGEQREKDVSGDEDAAKAKVKELEGLGFTDIEYEAVDAPQASDGGVEVVDAKEGTDTLPDRDLTEDPIAWLQKGSGELTTTIKGTTVITKKGFRVLQHKYDISTTSDVLVGPEETDMTFCRVKATAEMPDGRTAEAHASAHVDRGDDHFLLVSMADTRAKSRALSDVTGVGAVALEEMQGVDTDA